jgi:hypothetical protein
MDISQRLHLFDRLQKVFPTWALKRKASVIYHAFDTDFAKLAKTDHQARHDLAGQRSFETGEYEDDLLAHQSRKLLRGARRQYIHVPDLVWETGPFGARYLDQASLSKLYLLVKEREDRNRDFYLKLITALTGVIGALIGVLAFLKKGH